MSALPPKADRALYRTRPHRARPLSPERSSQEPGDAKQISGFRLREGADDEANNVRLGQKQTFAVQNGMSAIPPIADMCSALGDVCFVPKADILGVLLDHLISGVDQALRDS